MPGRRPTAPPVWTRKELDRERETALQGFIRERGKEGTRLYVETLGKIEPALREIFKETEDLRCFDEHSLLKDPSVLDAARYLAGPPISEDDLKTLAGGAISRRSLVGPLGARLTGLLTSCLDPVRLPWVSEGRSPSPHERETAIMWTAGLWAVERLRTIRRTESSKRQEAAVESLLTLSGYTLQANLRRIQSLDDLRRGSFGREALLAGSKCDRPVRLFDGRLLALECKVSNSPLNSVKRLIRETGGKSRQWGEEFGRKVITGAVLAGVFNLVHLVSAQEDHKISVFWEHDLMPMKRFVSRAR